MKNITLSLILITTIITNSFAGVTLPINFFSGKVYLLSINIGTSINGDMSKYTQSDATCFYNSLKKDTVIKEIIPYNFGDAASKADILIAIDSISKKCNESNIFIFYYSGFTDNGNFLLSKEKMSFQDFFNSTKRINARNQYFISDANNGIDLGESLKNTLFDSANDSTSIKNRIIISNASVAFEVGKGANKRDLNFEGGHLTGCIANSKYSITKFYNLKNYNDYFLTEFKHDLYESSKDLFDIYLFSEVNFRSEYKSKLLKKPYE